jgi:hypothetical protein
VRTIASGLKLDAQGRVTGEVVPVACDTRGSRICHWLNAVSLFVLIGSGLRIFIAFPSFGPKIPQHNFLTVPKALTIGGWLGGALQWHFTFMWIFVGTGLFYVVYQVVTGNFREVLFLPRDAKGVWPMVRYYFLFGKKPDLKEPYNALQNSPTPPRCFSECSRRLRAWCSTSPCSSGGSLLSSADFISRGFGISWPCAGSCPSSRVTLSWCCCTDGTTFFRCYPGGRKVLST